MFNTNILKAKEWFQELRANLINSIENIETSKFTISDWKHREEGGGKISKIKGEIIEKGGVNVSTVAGQFNNNFSKNIPGTEKNSFYRATGISVVLHPYSPHIPSMHFNTRYLETEKLWFGGGMDMTPCMPFEEENDYHMKLKQICDRHNNNYYPKFKKWCDKYFYLSHRKEARGIGGIFFDYKMNNWEKDFLFIKDIGIAFSYLSKKIIKNKMFLKWSKKEKEIQLLKRGRYVEYNLLYDRGTKFGLNSGGNPEAILMSMPPKAKWK